MMTDPEVKAEIARLTTERDEALADNKRLTHAVEQLRCHASSQDEALQRQASAYWALADAKSRAVQRAEKAEAERDEWKQKAEIKMSEREALTTFFHEGQRLEIGQLRADIAAARSSLGSIALTLRGLAALHQGDEHSILEEELLRIALAIDEDEAARLGTGEALAAVRMAQEVLQQYEREVGAVLPDGSKSGVALALTLLKAMFGEGG